MTFTFPRIFLVDNCLNYARKCTSTVGHNSPHRDGSAFIGSLQYVSASPAAQKSSKSLKRILDSEHLMVMCS